MTDRELLEKAAKAAGIEVVRSRLKIPRRKACRFDSGPGHHDSLLSFL